MSVEIRMSQRKSSVFIVIRIRGPELGSFSISDEGLRTFHLVCLKDSRVEAGNAMGGAGGDCGEIGRYRRREA